MNSVGFETVYIHTCMHAHAHMHTHAHLAAIVQNNLLQSTSSLVKELKHRNTPHTTTSHVHVM